MFLINGGLDIMFIYFFFLSDFFLFLVLLGVCWKALLWGLLWPT